MKEGLAVLYELQQLDDQIRELELSLKDIPDTIKALEQERDGKANMLEGTKAKLNANIKSREKLEKEIILVREKINKYRDQMSKATTNKEYQGFIAEIKYEEDNISTIEEKILEKMLESDEIMKEIRDTEGEFKKIADDYNKKIEDLGHTVGYNKTKMNEIVAEKEKIRAKIKPRLLSMYDRMSKNKGGRAVSLVESEFCGVCNVKIRPQHLNELRANVGISTCESCGRILYKMPEVEKEENVKN